MFNKDNKPIGTWESPPYNSRIELGCGHVLLLTAVSNGVFEGVEYCKKNRFELRFEGEKVCEFESDADIDSDVFFDRYIAPFVSDPDGKMRNAYLRNRPETKRQACEEYAESIWREGRALAFMTETCARYHVGDVSMMQAILLGYAATRVQNSEGVHVSVSGSKGSGKSHAVDTAIQCLPPEALYRSRLTDKALLYHNIPACSVIVMDDQELSEQMQEVIKSGTSDWDNPPNYLSVYSGKPVELQLPRRAMMVTCKANMTGDEQVLDRQLVFWTDESEVQRDAIRSSILFRAENPQLEEGEHDDMFVCQSIWLFVPCHFVKIPFARRIVCSDAIEPRNMNLLLSLIQASALLCAEVRECDGDGNLLATEGDFSVAAGIMNPLLSNVGGSQVLKLSSASSKVLDFLRSQPSGDVPFSEIRRWTGLSNAQLTYALYGRSESRTDGLLSVCNAVEVVLLSDSEDDGVRRRMTSGRKAIRWSAETYAAFEYLSKGWFVLGS